MRKPGDNFEESLDLIISKSQRGHSTHAEQAQVMATLLVAEQIARVANILEEAQGLKEMELERERELEG